MCMRLSSLWLHTLLALAQAPLAQFLWCSLAEDRQGKAQEGAPPKNSVPCRRKPAGFFFFGSVVGSWAEAATPLRGRGRVERRAVCEARGRGAEERTGMAHSGRTDGRT